jgi:hypothetical protein
MWMDAPGQEKRIHTKIVDIVLVVRKNEAKPEVETQSKT